MTLTVLLLLFALASVLFFLRWRKSAWLAVLLAGGSLWLAGCGPLAGWLLQGLQAPYAKVAEPVWELRNAIILLGAGNQRAARNANVEPAFFGTNRLMRALSLYQDCKRARRECMVLVSGGDATHTGHTEAQIYGDELLRLGVAPQDLWREPRSLNTWQNAQFSAPLLQSYNAQRVVLVSSATHLRRALLYFAHFGVKPVPVRADYLKPILFWWPVPWNLALCDVAWHEYVGVWRYALYDRMGWNVQAVKAGSP